MDAPRAHAAEHDGATHCRSGNIRPGRWAMIANDQERAALMAAVERFGQLRSGAVQCAFNHDMDASDKRETEAGDLLDTIHGRELKEKALRVTHPFQCLVSAINGDGVPDLLHKIDELLGSKEKAYIYEVSLSDGKKIAWLYSHGEVLERRDDEERAHLKVKLSAENKERQ